MAVLRPRNKLAGSARLARELGMEPLCASPIVPRFLRSEDVEEVLRELSGGGVEVVVFTSSTGVEAFQALVREPADTLSGLEVVAIGRPTARALERTGARVSFVPERYSSEGLVRGMPADLVEGREIRLLRSDHGSRTLLTGLEGRGARVRDVPLYELRSNVDGDLEDLIHSALEGEVDALPFTSSLSARVFVDAAADISSMDRVREMLSRSLVGAIGPPTRRTLEELGAGEVVVPEAATFRSLLLELRDRFQNQFGDRTH
ncbi:MAG: uroporphyrinogen-III synthase [Methanomassiliicoccales archaeon]